MNSFLFVLVLLSANAVVLAESPASAKWPSTRSSADFTDPKSWPVPVTAEENGLFAEYVLDTKGLRVGRNLILSGTNASGSRRIHLNGFRLELLDQGRLTLSSGIGDKRDMRSLLTMGEGARLDAQFLANLTVRVRGKAMIRLSGNKSPLNRVNIELQEQGQLILELPAKDVKWIESDVLPVILRDNRPLNGKTPGVRLETLGDAGSRLVIQMDH